MTLQGLAGNDLAARLERSLVTTTGFMRYKVRGYKACNGLIIAVALVVGDTKPDQGIFRADEI